MYSHPQTLSHCPGAAAALAKNARYVELFALLRNVSDISPQELSSVIKALIGASGPEYDVTSEGLMSSLSSNAEEQIRKAETFKETNGDIKVDSDEITAARLAAAPIHGFSQKQLVCHPLLGLIPNPALLCAAMKRLHSQSLIYLIHYLSRWFNNIVELDVIQGGESPMCDLAHVPCLDTVITWLAAAVDAGNLRLSTTEQGIEVLKKLREDLHVHIKAIQSLGALSGILEHLEKAHQNTTTQTLQNTPQGVFTSECFSL